jgi:hypothetical protein
MVLIAGAGIGVRHTSGDATSILILASLCISQALYLAVITDVQRLELPDGPPTKSMRALFVTTKINYYVNPIELPLAILLFLFELDLRLLWGATILLLVGALSVFLPEFMVLLSMDKFKAQSGQAGGFPDAAVDEAERIFDSRTVINWYATEPSKVPPEVLRITGSQPAPSNDPYVVEIRRKLEEDLRTLFRTSGRVFTLPCGQTHAMEAVASHVIEPGNTSIVIVGGPTGKIWSKIAQYSGSAVVEVNVSFGDEIDLPAVEQAIAEHEDAKVLFAVLTESTHGTLYDLANIGRSLQLHKRNIKFVVDCTGGFAVDDFRMDEWGVDFAVASCGGAYGVHRSECCRRFRRSYANIRVLSIYAGV